MRAIASRWVVNVLLFLFCLALPAGAINIVLGTENGSDLEFLQSGYPEQVELGNVSQFPKEVNEWWWPRQLFYTTLTAQDATNDLEVTMKVCWNDDAGKLVVALDVWTTNMWVEAGRAAINSSIDGQIIVPSTLLGEGGTVNFRFRAVTGMEGTSVVTWDQLSFVSVPSTRYLYVLGDENNSDWEFKQSNFLWDPIDLDSQPISAFPKEVNTFSWQSQYFYVTLNAAQALRDMEITANSAWSDSGGTLTVALDMWNGNDWEEVARQDVCNGINAVYTVPAAMMFVGRNDFRFRVITGNCSTTALTWDQIIVRSGTTPVDLALGEENSSDQDFLQSNFPTNFVNIDTSGSAGFPKEINSSWWTQQLFSKTLTGEESARDLVVTLKPYWSDGWGTLPVGLFVWNPDNSAWVSAGTAMVNGAVNGSIQVRASLLRTGENKFKMTAVAGSGNTTVVTWDQILVESEADAKSVAIILGRENGSDGDFLQYNFPASVNMDTVVANQFPKELNTSWWTNQEMTIGLTEKQASNRLVMIVRPYWCYSSYSMRLASRLWSGQIWVNQRFDYVNDTTDGSLGFGGWYLLPGVNQMALSVFNGGTNAMTWDQVILRTREDCEFPGGSIAYGFVDNDAYEDIVIGSAPGVSEIKIHQGGIGPEITIKPFYGYNLGVNVACGDVDGDGLDEIIAGPASTGEVAEVAIFSGTDGSEQTRFNVNNGAWGPVEVACGDVDADGTDEIIVGQGASWVRVYEADGTSIGSYTNIPYMTPYENYLGNMTVAAGDLTGDGCEEIVVGLCKRIYNRAGMNWGGEIRVFSLTTNFVQQCNPIAVTGAGWEWATYEDPKLFPGRMAVAVGDVDGNSTNEIVICGDLAFGGTIQTYTMSGTRIGSFSAYTDDAWGANVAVGDMDGDANEEIIIPTVKEVYTDKYIIHDRF